MKRSLLALLFAMVCAFACGQIQRSFWDASLGVSRKADVLRGMQGHGYTCASRNGGRTLQVVSYLKPLVFANVEIASVRFGFFRDSCYQVALTFKENYSQTRSEEFRKVSEAVARKYRSFQVDRRAHRRAGSATRQPASPRRTETGAEAHRLRYSDGKTLLTVDAQELTVTYTDQALCRRKDRAEKAELWSADRFVGCTFGVTTYGQACVQLAHTHSALPGVEGAGFIEKAVTFAGTECLARLTFHRGLFYQVSFRNRPGEHTLDFGRLRQRLDEKYADRRVRSDDDYAEYNDGRTLIRLRRHTYESSGQESVTLEYADVKILREKENVNLNEI